MTLDGFSEFVKRVKKWRGPTKLNPKNIKLNDAWDNFVYLLFLDRVTRESESAWLVKELEDILTYEKVRNTDAFTLRKLAISRMATLEKLYWKDSDRMRVLNEFKTQRFIDDVNSLHFYLKEASNYFANNIEPDVSGFFSSYIMGREGDFIAEIAHSPESLAISYSVTNPRKLRGVGYVIACKWLHSFNLAEGHCSPSRPVKHLLEERFAQYYEDFYVINDKVSTIAKEVSEDIELKVTNGDIDSSAWLYCTPKYSLVTSPKLRRKLSPAILLEYMKENKLDFDYLCKMIIDMDKDEELGEALSQYLQTV